MDDFVNIPERTKARIDVYENKAKEYFESIYQEHVEKNPSAKRLISKYRTWSVMSMDDNSMTLRSFTYAELIDESQRVKKFDIIF